MTDRALDLVLFRTFAGKCRACFAGRVMFVSQQVGSQRDSSERGRLRDAWHLLISRQVPSSAVEIRLGEQTWHTTTDRHGYFFTCEPLARTPDAADGWLRYTCTATHSDCARPITAKGMLLVAPPTAQRLIISDIDDTVVHTGVANKLKMMWKLYFAEADHRRPFPGMDDLLRGLHAGSGGDDSNPAIYVSRSPWSIHPMLDAFFNQHAIPVGPVLLLRDWGISWRHPLPRRAADHKARMIDSVLQTFPELPAILIGDSGQHDPEVYADVIRRHPGRIEAVYIRDLNLSSRRSDELQDMRGLLAARGIDLVVSDDTGGFVSHAEHHGWLPCADARRVQAVERRSA